MLSDSRMCFRVIFTSGRNVNWFHSYPLKTDALLIAGVVKLSSLLRRTNVKTLYTYDFGVVAFVAGIASLPVLLLFATLDK